MKRFRKSPGIEPPMAWPTAGLSRGPLATPWEQRRTAYDFVIVGSGYGGAVTAARIATASLNPKRSVCVLERGREWLAGTFPDGLDECLAASRSVKNPLGLYELVTYPDISIVKGNGLGGTSLINAGVAMVPDAEAFETAGWPASLNRDSLLPYFQRAASVLRVAPHPRVLQLSKVQALEHRAQQIGKKVEPLDLAVNFSFSGTNPQGVWQRPCIDCGDCITGCNVGAKNTLDTNYLPMAHNAGAELFTGAQIDWIEKLTQDGWRLHGRHTLPDGETSAFTMDAANVILAAGALNSTEILLRSAFRGLGLSARLGSNFSGNCDFFGLAYNGNYETDVLGFGNRAAGVGTSVPPGPTIAGAIRYDGGLPVEKRIVVEDFAFPSAYVNAAKAIFASLRPEQKGGDDEARRQRILRDLDPSGFYDPDGALNHSMLYLVIGAGQAGGKIVFEAPWYSPDGRIKVIWSEGGSQQLEQCIREELQHHAGALGAGYLHNPLWSMANLRHRLTTQPVGGCPIGGNHESGTVDEFGRVYSNSGGVHKGLFVADGGLLPPTLGVNPLLTICALAERIAERKIRELLGEPYA
jgi:cholesterol oxidase